MPGRKAPPPPRPRSRKGSSKPGRPARKSAGSESTISASLYAEIIRWVARMIDAHHDNVRDLEGHVAALQKFHAATNPKGMRQYLRSQRRPKPATPHLILLLRKLTTDGMATTVAFVEMHLKKAVQDQAAFLKALAPDGRPRDVVAIFADHTGTPTKQIEDLTPFAVQLIAGFHAFSLPESAAVAVQHKDRWLSAAVGEIKEALKQPSSRHEVKKAAQTMCRARNAVRELQRGRVAELIEAAAKMERSMKLAATMRRAGLELSPRVLLALAGPHQERSGPSFEEEVEELERQLAALASDPRTGTAALGAKNRHLDSVSVVARLCGVSVGTVKRAIRRDNAGELRLVKIT